MNRFLAIYPGSFDPVTNGHLDLIERAAKIFKSLIVAVLRNTEKAPLFTLPERLEMLREASAPFPNVEVDSFDGLLTDYARKRQAQVLLRGIRAVSDYEYELQMALMNRELSEAAETIFMLPAVEYTFVSSRLVKEVFRLGADVKHLVPPIVLEALKARLPVTAAST
jgi:pantetheine-phosphate adenylyltransferase